jgi:lipopolysaccharide export system permease protein
MKTLYKMLLKSFIPVGIGALVFFVVTLELVDLFANLWRYVQNDATVLQILRVMYRYLPKCIGFALPAALLFAVAYTLGSLYASNELIAVLGGGIPYFLLVVPFIVSGIVLSIGYFYFHETVIIESFAKKNALQDTLLGRAGNLNNPNVTVLGENGRSVYRADYYNDEKMTLSNLTVIHRDEEGNFLSRIDCDWAEYSGGWVLHNAVIYRRREGQDRLDANMQRLYEDPLFDAAPSYFQRREKDIDQLSLRQAKEWIRTLRRSGRPSYYGALTDYYSRFAFAFTPFIVSLLSCGIGNRLKKNVVLMSLLSSLLLSVVYYVGDMVLGLFAKQGIIVPAVGAWGSVLVFFALGLVLLRLAKT